MATDRSDDTLRLRATLASIAPGTALRDGLERILRGRTGALIVLGHDRTVESISTGGFTLDVPFTATGLRELAKMDGAIIIDKDVTRIHRAAVHLMPDHSIPSEETGTSRRTSGRPATSSRTSARSSPAPTRPSPRWSATSSASTRWPAPCRPSRSRTS